MTTKVAMIREPGHPIGQPAPVYLNCPCGAKPSVPAMSADVHVHCQCGKVYTFDGWLVR